MSDRVPEAAARDLKVVLSLGAAAVAILLAAVIGALVGDGDDDEQVQANQSGTSETTIAPGLAPGLAPGVSEPGGAPAPGGDTGISSGSGGAAAGATGKAGGTAGGAAGGATAAATTLAPGVTAPPLSAGDRTGVTDKTVKVGWHVPKTASGAPWGLADDPIKGIEGYVKYLNDRLGGVNGRKIEPYLRDDRYNIDGAREAANYLINDVKTFHVVGTLGVDLIAVVAAEAKKRGVPYMAGGGPESVFKSLNVFQNLISYDTAVINLAKWLAVADGYKDKKVIGVVYLNSPYVTPVVGLFKQEAEKRGKKVITASVQRPQEQTQYTAEVILPFKSANVEVYVPFHDPLTTSRIVAECDAQQCPWTYAFSDFAHELQASLALVPTWGNKHVRGLATGCHPFAPAANDPAKCNASAKAHQQWAAVYGEDDWRQDGEGGAAGYQFVYFWVEAMKNAGKDLTRERFVAALRSYENFSDVITSAVTFKGVANIAHGAEKMVVFEAQEDLHYKMISPGFLTF
jgi:branched-chain amino acid transport system substrate-binding protein